METKSNYFGGLRRTKQIPHKTHFPSNCFYFSDTPFIFSTHHWSSRIRQIITLSPHSVLRISVHAGWDLRSLEWHLLPHSGCSGKRRKRQLEVKKKDKMQSRKSRNKKSEGDVWWEEKRRGERRRGMFSEERGRKTKRKPSRREKKGQRKRRKGKRINRQRLDRVILGLQMSVAEGTAEDGSRAPCTTLGEWHEVGREVRSPSVSSVLCVSWRGGFLECPFVMRIWVWEHSQWDAPKLNSPG